MRIAVTVDPELPVPPVLYGGVERIVDLLVEELIRRGHDVTLFAHRDSNTSAQLIPWPGISSNSKTDTLQNAWCLSRSVINQSFDIVHSHSRLQYLLPLLPARIPKLMTYHRAISPRSVRLGSALSRGTLSFSSISSCMIQPVERFGRWHLVPNAVRLSSYDYVEEPGLHAPLVFLGRIEAIKGPQLAIEVAKRTGFPLILAGNIPKEHQGWFNDHIAPHLGRGISYIGPVDDHQKKKLLGSARALLMPILWEEPFGLVMIEAMACGTPVIGLSRGAVPEVVEHGVTGFVVDSLDQMVKAVACLSELSRLNARQRVENYYTETKMTDAYLSAYVSLVKHIG